MSITKFETPIPPVTPVSTKSNVGPIILGVLVVGAACYFGYKYIYLPQVEQKKQTENN